MSKKVAKLVRLSLVTRVIVDANASEMDILIQSQMKFIEQITNEIHENLEEIVDDAEYPYEESEDEVEDYIDVYASVELDTWLRYKEEIMSFAIDGINHHDNECRMAHEDDWNINLRIHREDYVSLETFCNSFETVEIDSDDRSDEVFDILSDEYLHSDVTSGEIIYSTTLSLEYTEDDVREGVQTFLDWDDSPETFKLIKGDKHWIIKCI